MAKTITMPQLGESVVEGTVGTWLVSVGDHVNEGDPLVEIETDKANTEVPATGSGYILELLVQEGETVEVGTEILRMGDQKPGEQKSEKPKEKEAPQKEAAPAPTKEAREPAQEKPAAAASKNQNDAPPEAVMDGPRGGVPGGHTAATKSSPAIEILRMGDQKPGEQKSEKPKEKEAPQKEAAPAPTKEAREPAQEKPAAAASKNQNDAPPEAVMDGPRGGVPGGHTAATKSSPAIVSGGRRQQNNQPAAKQAQAPAAQKVDSDLPYGAPQGAKFFRTPPVKANPEDTVIKFSRRRAIISEHMVYSKAVSPHVPTMAEVDMTKVMQHRRANKDRLREQGTNLTVFSYILAATAKALREFPGLNAVVGDGEIIQRGGVHIGIAVETDGGLVVPVKIGRAHV